MWRKMWINIILVKAEGYRILTFMAVIYGYSIKRFLLFLYFWLSFFFSWGYLRDNKVELLTNISFYAHMNSHFFVATQTQNVMNIKEGVGEGESLRVSRRFIAKTYISNKFLIIFLNWEPIELLWAMKGRWLVNLGWSKLIYLQIQN